MLPIQVCESIPNSPEFYEKLTGILLNWVSNPQVFWKVKTLFSTFNIKSDDSAVLKVNCGTQVGSLVDVEITSESTEILNSKRAVYHHVRHVGFNSNADRLGLLVQPKIGGRCRDGVCSRFAVNEKNILTLFNPLNSTLFVGNFELCFFLLKVLPSISPTSSYFKIILRTWDDFSSVSEDVRTHSTHPKLGRVTRPNSGSNPPANCWFHND